MMNTEIDRGSIIRETTKVPATVMSYPGYSAPRGCLRACALYSFMEFARNNENKGSEEIYAMGCEGLDDNACYPDHPESLTA